tara:strand:- start:84 stop:422 length:339 start_codon:yes stop_codon:yes gene_type:complete
MAGRKVKTIEKPRILYRRSTTPEVRASWRDNQLRKAGEHFRNSEMRDVLHITKSEMRILAPAYSDYRIQYARWFLSLEADFYVGRKQVRGNTACHKKNRGVFWPKDWADYYY